MKPQSNYRIYLPQSLKVGEDIYIKDSDKIHYIRNVLRLKLNDVIRTFNEIDGEFSTKITICDKKEMKLTLLNNKADREVKLLPKLSIAPCLIKNDKFASLIDMSIQSGATDIYPLISQNTVHRRVKLDRIERIILEATEQSERFAPAKIVNPMLLKEMDFSKFDAIIFANEKDVENGGVDIALLAKENILLLTGPEGGFTTEEVIFLSSLPNSYSISLGGPILRAETAMIRLISYVDLARRI